MSNGERNSQIQKLRDLYLVDRRWKVEEIYKRFCMYTKRLYILYIYTIISLNPNYFV